MISQLDGLIIKKLKTQQTQQSYYTLLYIKTFNSTHKQILETKLHPSTPQYKEINVNLSCLNIILESQDPFNYLLHSTLKKNLQIFDTHNQYIKTHPIQFNHLTAFSLQPTFHNKLLLI